MKRFSEQLVTKANSVKMTAAERRALRKRVVAYMEYHPLPGRSTTGIMADLGPALDADAGTLISIPWWALTRWSVTAAILLAVGVSYIAERSVPGDTLYAVKVRFNEEVRATLAWTPYEKNAWETERLNRRIAEARVLASEGRLTDAVETEVAAAVREHTENAQREIAVLKETDSDEAALATLALATTLDVQSVALRASHASGTATTTLKLATVLEETKNAATTGGEVLPSYERALARLERETTRARELLTSIASYATVEESEDITRRLDDIERSMAEAMGQASSSPDEARATVLEATARAQKLIVFMTNIDVRASMDVAVLVPVVLTPEEEATLLETELRAFEELYTRIEVALPQLEIDAPEAYEKAVAGFEQLTVERSRIVEAKASSTEVALSMVRGVLPLARDIVTLASAGAESGADVVVSDVATSTTTATTTEPAGTVEGVSTSTSQVTQ